jgi:hypothetical protein
MLDANTISGQLVDQIARGGAFSPLSGPPRGERRSIFAQFTDISQIGPAVISPEHASTVPDRRENRRVDIARFGWLATVLACLIAVLILILQGYYGYAGVTFAVAVSAAINLR